MWKCLGEKERKREAYRNIKENHEKSEVEEEKCKKRSRVTSKTAGDKDSKTVQAWCKPGASLVQAWCKPGASRAQTWRKPSAKPSKPLPNDSTPVTSLLGLQSSDAASQDGGAHHLLVHCRAVQDTLPISISFTWETDITRQMELHDKTNPTHIIDSLETNGTRKHGVQIKNHFISGSIEGSLVRNSLNVLWWSAASSAACKACGSRESN